MQGLSLSDRVDFFKGAWLVTDQGEITEKLSSPLVIIKLSQLISLLLRSRYSVCTSKYLKYLLRTMFGQFYIDSRVTAEITDVRLELVNQRPLM